MITKDIGRVIGKLALCLCLCVSVSVVATFNHSTVA